MQLPTAILLLLFCISCEEMVVHSKKTVKLRWYMHDTPFNGPNPSSIPVTAFNASDFQNEINNFLFGQIYVFDDPLTKKPSLTSASFGRSQGTYTFVSQEEIVGFVSYTVSIRTGKFKGSSLNVQGAYPFAITEKKFTIVGGTGHFNRARGILKERVVNLFGPFNASATLFHHVTVYLP